MKYHPYPLILSLMININGWMIKMDMATIFKDFLVGRKMFFTRERREILRAVEESGDWFRMEDILVKVSNKGMHLAKSTVYRNLQLLCSAGVVEMGCRNGQHLFHRHMTGRPVYRLHCRECDEDQDISDLQLRQFITDWCRERGYETDNMVVKIDVVRKCRACDCGCGKMKSADVAMRRGYARLREAMV